MSAEIYRHIRARPCSPVIGAYIEGVDVAAPAIPEVYAEIAQALWRHHVVFIRNQPMTPAAHKALASAIGRMVPHEIFPSLEGHPEISQLVANRARPPENDAWHTDVTFRETPVLASVLHGVTIPPCGGDTLFASQAAVYDALSPAWQRMLGELEAEHDIIHGFGQTNVLNDAGGEAKIAELCRSAPPKIHPVVVAHPITGRPGIFVNSVFTKRIIGLSARESDAILNTLFDMIKTPEFQVRFTWEPNSIAIWDNFGTQHYAVGDYWPNDRLMQRITVGTATPTAAFSPQRLAAE
jgi:taurine dioxygenase